MIVIFPEYNPLMLLFCSGNHERDWPGTGSFYANMDSGGECGVLAETMFYVPAENRQKFWYMTSEKQLSLVVWIRCFFYRITFNNMTVYKHYIIFDQIEIRTTRQIILDLTAVILDCCTGYFFPPSYYLHIRKKPILLHCFC